MRNTESKEEKEILLLFFIYLQNEYDTISEDWHQPLRK